MARLQVSVLMSALCALFVVISAFPDSGDVVPLPGPGLSYGGIPYGSVSGNVAEYFRGRAPSSSRPLNYLSDERGHINFGAIEQYL